MLKLAELLMAMVTLKKMAQALVSDCKSSLGREAKLYGSSVDMLHISKPVQHDGSSGGVDHVDADHHPGVVKPFLKRIMQ